MDTTGMAFEVWEKRLILDGNRPLVYTLKRKLYADRGYGLMTDHNYGYMWDFEADDWEEAEHMALSWLAENKK